MSSPPPPQIADRAALARSRARAARRSAGAAPFLHAEARDELELRLSEVNRRFTRPAIVTGLPDAWDRLLPGAALVADDEVLALEPGAHDLVIHAMALHWAADPVGQLVQARRALAPDGLFLAVLPGGRSLSELRAVLAEAETALRGGLSPRVLPMGEIRDPGALLLRAGFALPVADTVTLRAAYRSLRHLAAELRDMGEGNALAGRARSPAPRALFDTAEALYRRHFPAADGRILASFELIFLTGWSPADSQPKPLRPGSATHRLAEALGTRETPLDDPAGPPPRRDDPHRD